MKKLVIVLFITISIIGKAQNQPIRFGAKIGGNYSWLETNYSQNDLYKGGDFSGNLGLIGSINFYKNIGINTGLELILLRDKGSYLIFELHPGDSTYNQYKVFPLYFKIPVTVNFKTKLISNNFRFFGGIGNGFAVQIGAYGKYNGYDPDGNNISSKLEKTKGYSRIKLSGIINGGVEINIKKHMLLLGLQFNYCLNNLVDNDSYEVKNHYAEFFVGFVY